MSEVPLYKICPPRCNRRMQWSVTSAEVPDGSFHGGASLIRNTHPLRITIGL